MKAFIVVMIAALAMAAFAAAEDDDSPKCFCPRMYDPVCASNGRTYANRCEFDCVQKVQRSLRVLHRGSCDEIVSNDIEESFDLYE